uniref:GDT1 family protein n=1 Tax=Caenorhabditis japonica TaxID=281687 RepID=A0A8R1I0S3_CAEJA
MKLFGKTTWALLILGLLQLAVAENDVPKDVDTVDVMKNEVAKEEAEAPHRVRDEFDEETDTKVQKLSQQDITFYHGFLASFSVIVVSELGDKTWFIAVIMSMRHSRLTVFSGAMGALALMTVLSACLGWITQVIPRAVTYYLSTALFALFGLKMLHEGWTMSPNEGQEGFEEAQAEVAKREGELDASKFEMLEGGGVEAQSETKKIFLFTSRIFIEAFTLTFVAEWGDRSQLTTIILGARENIGR